ncbi:unnamed protein product [Caretta caretta]
MRAGGDPGSSSPAMKSTGILELCTFVQQEVINIGHLILELDFLMFGLREPKLDLVVCLEDHSAHVFLG